MLQSTRRRRTFTTLQSETLEVRQLLASAMGSFDMNAGFFGVGSGTAHFEFKVNQNNGKTRGTIDLSQVVTPGISLPDRVKFHGTASSPAASLSAGPELAPAIGLSMDAKAKAVVEGLGSFKVNIHFTGTVDSDSLDGTATVSMRGQTLLTEPVNAPITNVVLPPLMAPAAADSAFLAAVQPSDASDSLFANDLWENR